jgi:hypothetical protein
MASMKHGHIELTERFPEARGLWEAEAGNGTIYAYSINGVAVLIHEYHGGNGWQVYTPTTEHGNITKTLEAVDARTRGIDYDYRENP